MLSALLCTCVCVYLSVFSSVIQAQNSRWDCGQDIAEGETIFAVPTATTIECVCGGLDDPAQEHWSTLARVAEHVLRHMHDAESPWRPYILVRHACCICPSPLRIDFYSGNAISALCMHALLSALKGLQDMTCPHHQMLLTTNSIGACLLHNMHAFTHVCCNTTGYQCLPQAIVMLALCCNAARHRTPAEAGC